MTRKLRKAGDTLGIRILDHIIVARDRVLSMLVATGTGTTFTLELTRYIHLNPLRAGLVRDLVALTRYPWTGHAALMGRKDCP